MYVHFINELNPQWFENNLDILWTSSKLFDVLRSPDNESELLRSLSRRWATDRRPRALGAVQEAQLLLYKLYLIPVAAALCVKCSCHHPPLLQRSRNLSSHQRRFEKRSWKLEPMNSRDSRPSKECEDCYVWELAHWAVSAVRYVTPPTVGPHRE